MLTMAMASAMDWATVATVSADDCGLEFAMVVMTMPWMRHVCLPRAWAKQRDSTVRQAKLLLELGLRGLGRFA